MSEQGSGGGCGCGTMIIIILLYMILDKLGGANIRRIVNEH